MEKKMWFKPTQGSGIFKSDVVKNNLRKSEEAALVECLYLDTADMALMKNDAVLMIVDRGGDLKQMAVFLDESMAGEYFAALPDSGVDLTVFPQNVYQKLCGILNDAPLQIQFVSAFEEKKRILASENDCLLVRMLSHYDDGKEQCELCALSVQGTQAGEDAFQTLKLVGDGALTPCAPPYIEAMRLRSIGCNPSASEKRIKKAVAPASAYLLGIRLFELVRAYVALDTAHIEKKSILKLRVESRKLATLIEAFEDAFGEKTASYIAFLNKLIDDTDKLRAIDLIAEEIDTISLMHRDFDFTPLENKLVESRSALCAQYEKGSDANGLAALWVHLHKKMHEGLSNEEIIKATERIKEWAVELNVYKKTDFNDIDNSHAYRKTLRKLRYALESLSQVAVKRLKKAIKSCKRLQDEFGMAGDMVSHIKTLQRIASEEPNAPLALLCGVCCGVFAESLSEIQYEAVVAWKNCRNDLKALEDTL